MMAVTQTLFSANLIADVIPRIWKRDPEEGMKNLEELRQLTRVLWQKCGPCYWRCAPNLGTGRY